MRIGKLARATGASPRALRFYEQQGLLRSHRASNGYRTYGAEAAQRVSNIRYLLASGLTLEDIAHFRCCLDGDLPTTTPDPALVAIAQRRLGLLDERIRALTQVRDHLATGLRDLVGGGQNHA